MEKAKTLLNILGNPTRREILHLLSDEPYFVSQLAKELDIGQKAVIQHLELMESVGLVSKTEQQMERGRPRKYYEIDSNLQLEVLIAPYLFETYLSEPSFEKDEIIDDPFNKLRKVKDPLKRLEILSEVIKDTLMLIQYHEGTKRRLERTLERLKEEMRKTIETIDQSIEL
ncbi:MAG: ArsR/SmtB family transcription factor [Candidatus Hydrothermarchaeota archaeon]